MKRAGEVLLLVLFFAVGVFLRTFNGENQVYWCGDVAATRIIADRIVSGTTLPTTGPNINNFEGNLHYGPYHFYILAFLSLLRSDIIGLNLLTVAFECTTIIWLYLLVRMYFGKPAAFTAAGLYAFAPIPVLLNTGMLGSFMAIPILYAGIWMVLSGRRSRRQPMVIPGYVLIVMSSTISFSVLPIAAIIFLLDSRSGKGRWVPNLMTVVLSGAILFIPTLLMLPAGGTAIPTESFPQMIIRAIGRYPFSLYRLWQFFFDSNPARFPLAFGFTVTGFAGLLLLTGKRLFSKRYSIPVALLLILPFLMGALKRPDLNENNLLADYPVICGMVGLMLSDLSERRKMLRTAGLAFTALFLGGIFWQYASLFPLVPQLENDYVPSRTGFHYLKSISTRTGIDGPFDVRFIRTEGGDWDSPMLWYWAEKEFKTKLVAFSPYGQNIRSTRTDLPVYVVCYDYPRTEPDTCSSYFLGQYPGYNPISVEDTHPYPGYRVVLMLPNERL